MLLIRFFIFTILLFSKINDIPKDRTIFISPVKIPQLLSANFGELRVDHFHSGLDIKTQGVTGKEVVSAADGFISRIGISPTGFGNALYVTHPSGYTTVYGHLERFSPNIEKYVKARQYEKKSFTITLFPSKDDFPLKQGDLIAYTGNSGGSGGPHLHFEIRKSDSERPINPLLFDFGMNDDIKPVIEKLVIYPITSQSRVSNENTAKSINVTGSRGVYSIPQTDGISISGLTGFGIKAYDLLNDSNNKCAVYSIELTIDSMSVFNYVMDGFAFDESRFVNSHIDYETYMREHIYIEKAYVLPDDRLGVYKSVTNHGLVNFHDNKTHRAEIIVTDANKNRSVVRFKLKSSPGTLTDVKAVNDDIKIMPYNKTNKFVSENLLVTIPSGALYDTLFFSYKKEPGLIWMLSDVHNIHNKYTPVQKSYALSIKPTTIPAGKESKMLIIRLSDDKKIAVSSKWSDGYLTANVLTFGKFYVGLDTIKPEITPIGFSSGSNLTGKKELKIRITDQLSGIKNYEGLIDGNWSLFEYDQKYDLLRYTFESSRIKKGNHQLTLTVSDNKENVSVYNCNFTW
jgi:hypothetical protein